MRLSVALVASLATWTIFAGQSSIAATATHATVRDDVFAHVPSRDWINLDTPSPYSLVADHAAASWSPNDTPPVLLPLPPEGWAGASVLLTMACYRAIRRARLRS
jgi:hypothetical protein